MGLSSDGSTQEEGVAEEVEVGEGVGLERTDAKLEQFGAELERFEPILEKTQVELETIWVVLVRAGTELERA